MVDPSTLDAQLSALRRVIAVERAAGRDVASLAGTEHLLGARAAMAVRDVDRALSLFRASATEYRDAALHREHTEAALEGARTLKGAGRIEEALELAETALSGALRVWRELDAGARLEVPEILLRAADLAVAYAYEHGSAERLYDVMQKAKCASLGELLLAAEPPLDPALADVVPPGADPGGQRWRLEHALASLDAAWGAYFSGALDDVRPDAEALVARAYAAVEEPRRALWPASSPRASLDALQRSLGETDAVLEVFVTQSATYSVLVERHFIQRGRAPVSLAALRERALGAYVSVTETEGRRALARKLTGAEGNTVRRTLGAVARILYPAPPDFPRRAYEMLLRGYAPQLARVRRLVVCPHGPLHLTPLHALEDESGSPLTRSIAVTYAPNASAWVSSRAKVRAKPAAESNIVVLGVERRFSSPRSAAVARALGAPELEPPPSAIEEDTRTAASIYAVSPVLGGSVQKYTLVEALRRADQVHAACLSATGRDHPLAKGLLVADGVLSVAELLTTERLRDARASFVILETGTSTAAHPAPNERVVTLAYALAARLGAAVLVELWPMDPEAKALLLTRLHERRLAGEPLPHALRGAEEDVRAAVSAPKPDGSTVPFADPYYWGGFFLLEA